MASPVTNANVNYVILAEQAIAGLKDTKAPNDIIPDDEIMSKESHIIYLQYGGERYKELLNTEVLIKRARHVAGVVRNAFDQPYSLVAQQLVSLRFKVGGCGESSEHVIQYLNNQGISVYRIIFSNPKKANLNHGVCFAGMTVKEIKAATKNKIINLSKFTTGYFIDGFLKSHCSATEFSNSRIYKYIQDLELTIVTVESRPAKKGEFERVTKEVDELYGKVKTFLSEEDPIPTPFLSFLTVIYNNETKYFIPKLELLFPGIQWQMKIVDASGMITCKIWGSGPTETMEPVEAQLIAAHLKVQKLTLKGVTTLAILDLRINQLKDLITNSNNALSSGSKVESPR